MTPERNDWIQGARLVAVAVVSAVLTATFVIGAGQTLMDRREEDVARNAAPPQPTVRLIRTAG